MTNSSASCSIDGRFFDELQAKALQKNWGWLLALGILFIVIGTFGLGRVFLTTILSVLFFGVLMLVGSVVQLIGSFRLEGWKNILWQIIVAILYAVSGFVILSDPLLASVMLTAILAGSFIISGIMRIIGAFQIRGAPGFMWMLIGGLISIGMGVYVFAKFPGSALWVIGLFVSVELIINGWSYVTVALGARKEAKENE